MESSIIERLDQLRNKLLRWFIVGFGAWYGMNILSDLTSNVPVKIIATFVGLTAWIFWSIALIKMIRLGKTIKRDNFLKNALNDELFQHYRSKSFVVGFWSFLITIGIFLSISTFYEIPALIVCKVTLYIGVLSALIAAAILYNRGRDGEL